MQKPTVRVIASQEEHLDNNVDVSQYEIDKMLAKYGHSVNHVPLNINSNNADSGLTFEELIRRDEENIKRRQSQIPKPQTYTMNPNSVIYQTSSYVNDDDFGFKITVSSDMDINGNMYQ
jgi:hypothetical protein